MKKRFITDCFNELYDDINFYNDLKLNLTISDVKSIE
jgi:hypothetical protein